MVGKNRYKCFLELLNRMDVLKILQISVLVQILFIIFINDLANSTEGISLLYNILLKGDCRHFERPG